MKITHKQIKNKIKEINYSFNITAIEISNKDNRISFWRDRNEKWGEYFILELNIFIETIF